LHLTCRGSLCCGWGHGHEPAGLAPRHGRYRPPAGRIARKPGKGRKALEILPNKAVRDVNENDLDEYMVVRVADEIVVDLMLSACGLVYAEAAGEIEIRQIQGVSIPFASARFLLRTKQTYRDKDIPDRIFLERKLRENS